MKQSLNPPILSQQLMQDASMDWDNGQRTQIVKTYYLWILTIKNLQSVLVKQRTFQTTFFMKKPRFGSQDSKRYSNREKKMLQLKIQLKIIKKNNTQKSKSIRFSHSSQSVLKISKLLFKASSYNPNAIKMSLNLFQILKKTVT